MSHATKRHHKLRWTTAVILLVLGSLALSLSVPAIFVRNQLLSTERWVSTVAPLARNPDVQKAIANRITNEISTQVDLESKVRDSLAGLDRERLADALSVLVGPVAGTVRDWLHKEVLNLVESEDFAKAWDTANRVAHDQLDHVLTGSDSGIVTSSGKTVSVDVGAFVGVLAKKLADRGFDLAAKVPSFSVKFTLIESDDLPKIRSAVSALNTTATWLPIAALALLAAGVFLAPNHRRATLTGGVLVAALMGILLIAIVIARNRYLANLPATVQSEAAAAAIFDIVIRNLKTALQVLLTIGILTALFSYLFGPGRLAVLVRTQFTQGLDAGAQALSSSVGSPAWLTRTAHYREWVYWGIAVLGVLVWLLWDPTRISTLLWLILIFALLIGVIELLLRAATFRPSKRTKAI